MTGGLEEAARSHVSVAEVRAVVAALEQRFPGAVVWYGTRTHRWWAMLRHRGWRGELIEAVSPAGLADAIGQRHIGP